MVGEQYYLFLIKKDGTEIQIARNKPVTIEAMDKRTTKYNNKNELIDAIIKNTGNEINPDDILDIELRRKPNSKKEFYFKEIGPLFSDDIHVFDTNKVFNDFNENINDPIFVLNFIKRYAKVKGLRNLINEIEAEISNGDLYNDELKELINKLSKTYKGRRNIYLFSKNYDDEKQYHSHFVNKEQLVCQKSPFKSILNTDSKPLIPELSEDEIEEMNLEYLKEYDRELLDIEDFNGFRELSPFDNKKRKF